MEIEICEPKIWGKVVYVSENGEITTPGLWGEVVYKIKNGSVYGPGFFGKEVYRIKGNEIKEAKSFGDTVFTVRGDSVYQGRNEIYRLRRRGESSTIEKTVSEIPKYEQTVSVQVTITETTPFDGVVYDETRAYCTFLNKYRIVKHPDYLTDDNYSKFEFALVGVNSPHALHKELVGEGFYQDAKITDALTVYKVGEIQAFAKQLGFNPKGKKDELIKFISDNTTMAELQSVIGEKIIAVSDKGNKYLEDNKLVMEYYALGDTILTLEEYVEKRKKFSANDMRWQHLQKQLKEDTRGYGRNAFYAMANILQSENKNEDALLNLLRVLYLDVNYIDFYTGWKQAGFPKDMISDIYIALAPGLLKDMRQLKAFYSDELVEQVYEQHLPFLPCEKKKFKSIVFSILDNTIDTKKVENELIAAYKRLAKTKI